jgi:hypothetical protein
LHIDGRFQETLAEMQWHIALLQPLLFQGLFIEINLAKK